MKKESETKREIGLFFAIIAGLGSTLGIEFFMLFDFSIKLAGPGVLISLFLSGLLNLLIMFNYAELSSCISEVGAEYTFTKVAFGGFICFLSGWLRWLSSIFTATLSTLGFAVILKEFFPWIPTSLVSTLLIILFTLISVKGGKKVDLASVLSFTIILSVIVILGIIRGLDVQNLHPLMPQGFFPGVMAGSMYTFGMYVGMRAIVTRSPDIRDPGKTLPRAVIICTIISIAIYSSIAFVAVTINFGNVSPSPYLLIRVGNALAGSLGSFLVLIAWVSASLMSLATSMTVQTSILSALSRDGYLPSIIFSSKSGSATRYIAQIFGSILAVILSATGLINFVGYASGFTSLLVFALVNFSLIRLRKIQPDLERPFKTPFYPYNPIIGIAVAFILMIFVESSAIIVVFEFVLISIMIYHLKMIGYDRLRIALGGINMGISVFILLTVSLTITGITNIALSQVEKLIFLILGGVGSVIFFVGGILNLITPKKDQKERVVMNPRNIITPKTK